MMLKWIARLAALCVTLTVAIPLIGYLVLQWRAYIEEDDPNFAVAD